MKGPTIKLGDEGAHCEDSFNALLHAVVLESDARLKLATPVDTGRLRNAWTIGQNSAPKHGDGVKTKNMPKGRSTTKPVVIADSATQAVRTESQRYEGYTRGNEKVGNNYIIANNMEYAEPVAFGTNLPRSWGGTYRSKQNAVPGYPELIAKGMEKWAQAEWSRMANSGKY